MIKGGDLIDFPSQNPSPRDDLEARHAAMLNHANGNFDDIDQATALERATLNATREQRVRTLGLGAIEKLYKWRDAALAKARQAFAGLALSRGLRVDEPTAEQDIEHDLPAWADLTRPAENTGALGAADHDLLAAARYTGLPDDGIAAEASGYFTAQELAQIQRAVQATHGGNITDLTQAD